MFTTVGLISITTYNDNFFLWWELKDLFLSNFQIYSRILLTTEQQFMGLWGTRHDWATEQPPCYTLHLHDFFCNWMLVSFDPFHPFCLPPPSPHLWSPPICSLYLWAKFYFGGFLQRRVGCLLFFFVWNSTCEIILLFIFVWLTSLSIMPSKSIHVVANGKVSFFIMVEE